jgi:hypothetical protein
MRFYNVDMKGKFINQRVTGGLPSASPSDEGRMVYYNDDVYIHDSSAYHKIWSEGNTSDLVSCISGSFARVDAANDFQCQNCFQATSIFCANTVFNCTNAFCDFTRFEGNVNFCSCVRYYTSAYMIDDSTGVSTLGVINEGGYTAIYARTNSDISATVSLENQGDNSALYAHSCYGDSIVACSPNKAGIAAISTTCYGVYGCSTDDDGVHSRSDGKNGVYGSSYADSTAVAAEIIGGVHGYGGVYANGVVGSACNGYGVYATSTNAPALYVCTDYSGVNYSACIKNDSGRGLDICSCGAEALSVTSCGGAPTASFYSYCSGARAVIACNPYGSALCASTAGGSGTAAVTGYGTSTGFQGTNGIVGFTAGCFTTGVIGCAVRLGSAGVQGYHCTSNPARIGTGVAAFSSLGHGIISCTNTSCYGVWGISAGGAGVAGNTAYCNTSSRYLKHLQDVCLTSCIQDRPLKVYKYYWEDANNKGFNLTVGPMAEDFNHTFRLTNDINGDDYEGLWSVEGVALGLAIENVQEIDTLKEIVTKLYSCIQKLEGGV